jgi:hypothetical protein
MGSDADRALCRFDRTTMVMRNECYCRPECQQHTQPRYLLGPGPHDGCSFERYDSQIYTEAGHEGNESARLVNERFESTLSCFACLQHFFGRVTGHPATVSCCSSVSRSKGHGRWSVGSKRNHTSIRTLERRSSRSEIRTDITSRLVRSLRGKRASQLPKLAGAPKESAHSLKNRFAELLMILIESRISLK